ncbi:MAG: Gfo/Idh/MocA family oxidoreductase [Chloroflexi bacterium]|nr:MAG: Gfo/Idh/MocA family oxidoreductase [Chloroflexota bacterium]
MGDPGCRAHRTPGGAGRRRGVEQRHARSDGEQESRARQADAGAIPGSADSRLLRRASRRRRGGRRKHVLCEKPIGVDAAEAEEMAAAAKRSGRHLMEAFMYRFHPAMREFVESIREPLHVQATFGFTAKDPNDIRLQRDLGGGALLDVGSYTVSVSRWILGEPDDVAARGRFKDGIDVTISGLLTFAGGSTASVWASVEAPEEQDLKVITRSGVLRRVRPFSAYRDPHDPYQLMVESFADSVLHDRPVAIPLAESIANMRVLDRIQQAARA